MSGKTIAATQKGDLRLGDAADSDALHIPAMHLKALRPDAQLVVGGSDAERARLISALLTKADRRAALDAAVPELRGFDVHAGFIGLSGECNHADCKTLSHMLALESGLDAYGGVWRSHVLRWVAQRSGVSIPADDLPQTYVWLKRDPEAAARLIQQPRTWSGMILFASLDQMFGDGQEFVVAVRDLMRLALWLRTYPGLRAKIFLTAEQFRLHRHRLFAFPDGSKIWCSACHIGQGLDISRLRVYNTGNTKGLCHA